MICHAIFFHQYIKPLIFYLKRENMNYIRKFYKYVKKKNSKVKIVTIDAC